MGFNYLLVPLDGVDASRPFRSSRAPETARTALVKAREILRFRLARAEYLSDDLLGEPGWDLLLTAFVADSEGHKSPVASISAGAACPPTTALRWINLLERRGLLVRTPDPTDSRRVFVKLSEEGRTIMEQILERAP